MALLRLLVLILMFNELLLDLDAMICPKGQEVSTKSRNKCKDCSKGYFQPEEHGSQECKTCKLCDENCGSEVKKECTTETDTVCQCREGFVMWFEDNSVCKCEPGFGMTTDGSSKIPQCTRCEKGYFSQEINTACQKWKDCKSAGVRVEGTATSDVICNEEQQNASHTTSLPTPNRTVSITPSTNQRPHGGAQTSKMLISITTRAPRQVTVKGNQQPIHPSNSGSQSGVAFILLGTAGILLMLTAVIFKLHIIPCWKGKATAGLPTKDSMCRRPVEESGDGSEVSLKQNPEEV